MRKLAGCGLDRGDALLQKAVVDAERHPRPDIPHLRFVLHIRPFPVENAKPTFPLVDWFQLHTVWWGTENSTARPTVEAFGRR